jgi:peptide deformylase
MHIVVPEEFQYLYERNDKRPVVKIPDPALRIPARQVNKVTKQTSQLIDNLFRCMRLANGIGLAAPQLAISQRVLVMAPSGVKPVALVNPRIVKAEGSFVGQEGCLSIPGLYGDVERAEYVEVEALDRKGRELVFELEGLPARVAQHEIDHLDGILFIDKVIVETLHWSHPDEDDGPVE